MSSPGFCPHNTGVMSARPIVFPLNPKQFSAHLGSRQLAGALALLLAAACAGSAVAWTLRLMAHPSAVPIAAGQAGRTDIDALAAQAPAAFHAVTKEVSGGDKRLQLLGVIGGGARAGSALISVDGKPPRAVAVGEDAAPGLRLESTGFDHAALRRDGTRINLKVAPQSPGALPVAPMTLPASMPLPLPGNRP